MRKIMVRLVESAIRKLLKIKNKLNMSTEVQTEQKIYVWTKTEEAGKIVTVASEQPDREFLYFEDGSRIKPQFIKEYLIEAKDLEDAKMHASSFGNTLGLNSSKKEKAQEQAPHPPVGAATAQNSPVIAEQEAIAPKEVNVMMEMLSKMSKKNQAEMPVIVNLPSSAVYEMLQDQMDLEKEDLNEQIGLLVENQINNLQEQLRQQIQTFISNYYNNESREHSESE